MDTIKLSDLNILDFGNSLQISAAVYSNQDKNYLCILPDEFAPEVLNREFVRLELSPEDWERVLRQTDILEVIAGPTKAIIRKSQRQIDQNEAWATYRRDGFKCRYCGRDSVPLTVDHIDLWEDGGISIRVNLVSACRPCNKARGNMPYEVWLKSKFYQFHSTHLTNEEKQLNIDLVAQLPYLKTLRTEKQRSR
jgi:5-methylcytosine-specific restriction endonuclease McrA